MPEAAATKRPGSCPARILHFLAVVRPVLQRNRRTRSGIEKPVTSPFKLRFQALLRAPYFGFKKWWFAALVRPTHTISTLHLLSRKARSALGGDVDQGEATSSALPTTMPSVTKSMRRSNRTERTDGQRVRRRRRPGLSTAALGVRQPDHQTMFGWCSAPPRPSIPHRWPTILRAEHTDPRSAAGGPSTPSATARPIENTWPVILDVATTMRHIASWVKHGSADSCICSGHHTRMGHGRLRSHWHSLPTVAAVPSWS